MPGLLAHMYRKMEQLEDARCASTCEEVGVDAFEINFSCPHGLPERKAAGEDACFYGLPCSFTPS
eukprot:1140941-Pelagomonas_calceolata.AAC.8